MLLCSSVFQAAPGAILLWSGYYFWSVCLFVVTVGAFVVFVVAADSLMVACN